MKTRTIQPRSMQELLASAEGRAESPWSATPGFRGPMPQPGEGHPHATDKGLVDRHAFVDELSRWRESLGWRDDPRDEQISSQSQPERAPLLAGGDGGAFAGALLVPGTCDKDQFPDPAWGGPPRHPPCNPCGVGQEQRYSPGTGLRCCPPGRARPHCPCPEGTWPDAAWVTEQLTILGPKKLDDLIVQIGGVPCVPIPNCPCPTGTECQYASKSWKVDPKTGSWYPPQWGGEYKEAVGGKTASQVNASYNSVSQLWLAADPGNLVPSCVKKT